MKPTGLMTGKICPLAYAKAMNLFAQMNTQIGTTSRAFRMANMPE